MKKDIIIRKEAHLTVEGTHSHGNCEPVICPELQKTFSSIDDTAEYFNTTRGVIWKALNGYTNALGLWERDENGKRKKRIAKCHLYYAKHAEEAMNAVMECGRENLDKLNEARSTIDQKNNIIASKDAEIAALQEASNPIEELKELNETIKRRQKMLDDAKNEVARLEVFLAEAKKEMRNKLGELLN